ncbi:MAG TPA: Ku protein [Terriglobia bacterium]|jgi:DNA end-binding protein Ku
MAARAIWAGRLKLGSSGLQVKLYSAVEDRSIRFHMLEAKTKTRIKQHMVNPDTGEEVPREQIRKGYEIDRGTFVLLDDDELSSLQPRASRDIDIIRFVPAGRISHLWYERPYYLGPDGNTNPYFAFVQALKNQNREGIVRWVMRNKGYTGALRVSGDYLSLITLHPAEEVLSDRDLPAPRTREVTAKELKMANELVGALEGELNFEQFHDEYRDRLLDFIKAKAKGRRPKLHPVRTRRATASLERGLAKSLVALKSGKERKVA